MYYLEPNKVREHGENIAATPGNKPSEKEDQDLSEVRIMIVKRTTGYKVIDVVFVIFSKIVGDTMMSIYLID